MNLSPDPFDLLRLPARPFLSKADVEAAFRTAAGRFHPDQGGATTDFQQAVESAAILSSPSRRLLALLKRASVNTTSDAAAPSPELVNLSFELEVLRKEAGDTHSIPSSKVARAMSLAGVNRAKRKLAAFLAALAALESDLQFRLGKLDDAWANASPADRDLLNAEAKKLAVAFAFFEKLELHANAFSANLAVCGDNLLLSATPWNTDSTDRYHLSPPETPGQTPITLPPESKGSPNVNRSFKMASGVVDPSLPMQDPDEEWWEFNPQNTPEKEYPLGPSAGAPIVSPEIAPQTAEIEEQIRTLSVTPDRKTGKMGSVVSLRGVTEGLPAPPQRRSRLAPILWSIGGALLIGGIISVAQNPDVRLLFSTAKQAPLLLPGPESTRQMELAPNDANPAEEPQLIDPALLPGASSGALEAQKLEEQFSLLLEQADAAAASGDPNEIARVVSTAFHTAERRPDVLLSVATALAVTSPNATSEESQQRRASLRPLYARAADEALGMPDLLVRCADYFAAVGEPDEARRLYDRAGQLAPGDGDVNARHAAFAMQSGFDEEAIQSLKNLAAALPRDINVRRNLVRLLISKGSLEEALPHLTVIREAMPEYPAIYVHEARTLLDLNRAREALALLDAAPEKVRGDDAVRFTRLLAEYRAGFTQSALLGLAEFSRGRTEDPPPFQAGEIAYNHGVALLLSGQRREAAKLFEEAIQRNPKSLHMAKNNLAWLLAAAGEDPERAVALAREAISERPSEEAYKDTLARALLAANRPNEAFDVVSALVQTSSGRANGDFHETLGDIEMKRGSLPNALAAWRTALTLGVGDFGALKQKIADADKSK